MNLAVAYGLIASALVMGAAAACIPWRHRRLGGAVAALLAVFTAAPWLHGILGAPSFTLALGAAITLIAPGRPALPGRGPALVLVLVAAVFYPLSLGLGPVDPFALGYRPLPLLAGLALLGLVLAWRRQGLWLLVLGADLGAYAVGLFANLWSALFDPLLVLLAIVRLLRRPQRNSASPIS